MKHLSLILFILLTPLLLPSPAEAGVKKEVKKGNLLYNKGQFEEALKSYQKAHQSSPDSDVVNFDLGAALYKTKNYGKAIGHFEKSLVSNDPSLEEKASYNSGNAKYKYGISQEEINLPQAVNLLEQSLRHYERAIELEPKDEDAKYNYEFVKKELERLKKKLQQQKQEQQKKKGAEDEEEKEKERPEERDKEKEKPEEKQKPQEEEVEAEEKEPEKGEEEAGRAPQEEKEQPEEEEKKEEEPSGQREGKPQKPTDEMSEKEASMLLDSYRQEEEPRELYKEKIPPRELPEVLKDW